MMGPPPPPASFVCLEVAVQMNDLTTSTSPVVNVTNRKENRVHFLSLKLVLHTVLRMQ